ncbi:MAG TPA: SNF2-related protein [Plasticicumulans sp.]|uniref:helicase-related protein n=1 Tax=Plasticicumulans sp. TaxID=2307179 RepID=UPI002CCCA1A5|nr:helicase-related protein [Plasticicumulans sp.]HMV38173.1 SNF2-related protein [Plasticicumulans sp.]HMW28076.1 SNF2-related protein [Plasticicumulans sp.]HNG48037.1 SNF2-related protein [Plasticicumulans sp.]HNK31075.1 SNF2-related protein [Plasticicumulans sp.]HNM44462.1 SNF2-related protein [Plasticicumulans sp.]
MSRWQAGMPVRLLDDPGQTGVVTGLTRERGEVQWVQVRFPAGCQYYADYELETLDAAPADPYDRVLAGRFGRTEDLRRQLTRIQLSGRLANLIYSLDTTATDFYAHQFKPVLSFLESPCNGLLIADEVGLGKTIEAGLIWTELRARLDARRLLVVCPAMLREKWRDELRRRFGIRAELVGAGELLAALREPKDTWPAERALVGSLQGLRPSGDWQSTDEQGERAQLARLLDEQADAEPLFDLVVIDEAHYLRNPQSLSAELGRLLREVSAHLVLLSATPVNTRADDLFELLRLVDPENFRYGEQFQQVLLANRPLLRARACALDLRASLAQVVDELRKAQAHPLLAGSRQLQDLIAACTDGPAPDTRATRIELANRIERVNLLAHAVTRTRKAEVQERRVVRRVRVEAVEPTDAERALYESVTDAVRGYAWQRDVSDGFLLAMPQRQVSSSMAAACTSWLGREDALDAESLFECLTLDIDRPQGSPLVRRIAEELAGTVDTAELARHDSKYQRLHEVLIEYLREHPDEKVVVFSYFRPTLRYLARRLEHDGLSACVLMGGMRESKQDVIDRFRDTPQTRVLLSSEVASEGVDLQFCRVLVNYDLPWNPMRIEQRIGRIDRLGQRAESIFVWNLCYAGTIDERIVRRLYERLNLFETALGSLEDVLGDEIARLTQDLLCQKLTSAEEELRIDQTAQAIEQVRQQQDELERQASTMIAHGGYILEQVNAAHTFRKTITAGDLAAYVRDYLERHAPGHTLYQPGADPFEFDLRLPPAVAVRYANYLQVRHLLGQSRLGTGDEVRCRFENRVGASSHSRIETISQFHPLPRFIGEELERLETSVWPVVALRLDRQRSGLPSLPAPGIYAFALLLTSFSGMRTEEELLALAWPVDADAPLATDLSMDLVNAAKHHGADWPGVAADVDLAGLAERTQDCFERLLQTYAGKRRAMEAANHDRIRFQLDALENHRRRKLDQIEERLAKLRAAGRTRRVINATEGQRRKLEERIAIQRERLNERNGLKSDRLEVCRGLIRIE